MSLPDALTPLQVNRFPGEPRSAIEVDSSGAHKDTRECREPVHVQTVNDDDVSRTRGTPITRFSSQDRHTDHTTDHSRPLRSRSTLHSNDSLNLHTRSTTNPNSIRHVHCVGDACYRRNPLRPNGFPGSYRV